VDKILGSFFNLGAFHWFCHTTSRLTDRQQKSCELKVSVERESLLVMPCVLFRQEGLCDAVIETGVRLWLEFICVMAINFKGVSSRKLD